MPPTLFSRTEQRVFTAEAQRSRGQPATRDICFWGVIALLLFGPLAFGAVEAWAMLVQQVTAAVLITLWAIGNGRGKAPLHGSPLFLPAAVVALIVAVQLAATSAYRNATILAALEAAVYAAIIFLVAQSVSTRERVKLFARALTLFGAALAFVSILFNLASPQKLYGLREPRVAGWMYGPYVNHNHYAGLMEMLVAFPLLAAFRQKLKPSTRMAHALAAFVMAGSIVLSGSRGGMIVFAVELGCICVIAIGQGTSKRMGRALVAGLLLLAIFVAWYDSGRVSQALGSLRHPEISTATRRQIAADALHMAMARPLLGWGFGTFAWIYPQFRSFYTNLPIHAAHDDFAQALAELGFLGFAAITWLLVIVFRRASRRLKDWEADSASCAQLASAIGAGALLLHGLSDFNMQVPANAAMFFALCAITCAGRNHDFSARQPGKFASAVLVLAALLFAVMCGISFREQQLARTWEPARLVRAAQFNRFDAQPWLRLGYLELNAADSEAAALDLARAAQLNPHDARTWLELAQAHSALADDAGAKHSLDVAVSYAPTTPTNLAVAAGLYFQIGERQAGLAQLRALTENSPDLVPASVELAWRATHDVEIVLQKVAARNVDAQFALLQVLIEHDDLASAKRVWAQIHREHPTLNARQAFSYLQFLIEKNDGSEAEAVWRAVTAQPAYAAYRGDEGRLVNGGFESGVLNAGLGWRYQEAQGVKVFLDPSVAHGGKQSLALAFHGEVAETGMMQYVPVKPNANYHLGGFFQSKQLDGAGGLQWQIIENGTGTLLGATPTLTEADSWEEFGADFDTGPKTQIVVLRLVRMPEGNVLEGKVWFDDLSLASKPSAIGNGSRKH